MIDAPGAVRAARAYVTSLYDAKELPHLRLEEIEPSNDSQHWYVTLGWDDVAVYSPPTSAFSAIVAQDSSVLRTLPRVYKRVVVNATSGQVEAMKIRDVG